MPAFSYGTHAQPNRRHLRRQRVRRRLQRTLAIVLGTALGACFVLIATDTVRFGGGDRPSLAGTVETPSSTSSASITTAAPEAQTRHRCRTLDPTDPLALWVGGDSLAGSLGPALGTLAGASGVVQPYWDSRVSSGLSNPGFFDWPTHATSEMTRLSPEIVVFIIGANDGTGIAGSGADTSSAWKSTYAQNVEKMLNILEEGDRTVYWVGSPILKDLKSNEGVQVVDEVASEVVKRHPNAHYVDAYKLFSDSAGKYTSSLTIDGKTVYLRTDDGIHLTPDGGDYLARAVFKLIDAQCRVREQSVTGQAKQAIQTQGSTLVGPGFSPTSTTPTSTPSSTTTSSSSTTTSTTRLSLPNLGPQSPAQSPSLSP